METNRTTPLTQPTQPVKKQPTVQKAKQATSQKQLPKTKSEMRKIFKDNGSSRDATAKALGITPREFDQLVSRLPEA